MIDFQLCSEKYASITIGALKTQSPILRVDTQKKKKKNLVLASNVLNFKTMAHHDKTVSFEMMTVSKHAWYSKDYSR